MIPVHTSALCNEYSDNNGHSMWMLFLNCGLADDDRPNRVVALVEHIRISIRGPNGILS